MELPDPEKYTDLVDQKNFFREINEP